MAKDVDNAAGALLAEARFAALLRPELEELRAYVPHDPPGIEVKLDANEAPAATSPAIREAVARAVSTVALERYPDPRALRLKDAIAKRTGARPEDLLLGTGSDEVIALLQTALARPQGKNPQAVVLSPVPTFVMYRITARGHGWKPVEVPLDAAWDLVKDWTAEERQRLRDDVPRLGFKAEIRGLTVGELAREMLTLARTGLRRRDRLDMNGCHETRYLDPIQAIVDDGRTPAEALIEKYLGPWQGQIDRVFEEQAY